MTGVINQVTTGLQNPGLLSLFIGRLPLTCGELTFSVIDSEWKVSKVLRYLEPIRDALLLESQGTRQGGLKR